MNKINEIKEAVLAYINNDVNVDTDFAIMIDGEWGSGKTHFWKNEIADPLRKLNTLESFKLAPNNHSNKKIIYISLYGLNKLEDIDNNITTELFTPETLDSFKKHIPKINSLMNSGLSIIKLAGLTSIKDEIFKLIKENKLDKNFNEIILCFDDLERSSLQIDLVLGYINRFVEHNNIKAIIICNESEIDKENEKYKRIKEKLIGFTYRYEPSIEEIIQNFIKPYSVFVKDTINDNLLIIQDVIKRSECNNLRTIKQSLSLVNKIISCYFEREDNPQKFSISSLFNNPFEFNIISEIIKFVFCLNFEIKLGISREMLDDIGMLLKHLETSYLDGYSSILNYLIELNQYENDYKIAQLQDKETPIVEVSLLTNKPYIIKFLEKYYDYDYNYQTQFRKNGSFPSFGFSSIYEFITRGYFNKDLFQKEIEQNFVVQKNPKLMFLYYDGYQNISDKDFDEASKYYIDQFKNLEEPTIKNFHDILLLTRHLLIISNQRLIQETPEEIKQIILSYLDKLEDNKSQLNSINPEALRYKSENNINKVLRNDDNPINSLIFDKVFDKVKKINDDVIKIKKHRDISDIINLQNDFFVDFYKKICSLEKNEESIFDILNLSDIEILAQKIVKLSNSNLDTLRIFFNYRKEIFISEYSNLNLLKNLLSEYIDKSESRKLSFVFIEKLIEKIDEYIKKIEPNPDSYS